jgi:hypothetical protein
MARYDKRTGEKVVKAWGVWTRKDRHEPAYFADAFRTKGAAQARVRRLVNSDPENRKMSDYEIRQMHVPARMLFENRGHGRAKRRESKLFGLL